MIVIGAALLLMAMQAAPTAALGDVRQNAHTAIDLCRQSMAGSMTTPSGARMYVHAPDAQAAAMYRRIKVETQFDLPELATRFKATTLSGRSDPAATIVTLPASDGQVWVVLPVTISGCDIAVTGKPDKTGMAPDLVTRLVKDGGWKIATSKTADGASPLSTTVLTLAAATPEKPRFGYKLRIDELAPHLSSPDGIQLEIGLTAGEIQSKPASTAAN